MIRVEESKFWKRCSPTLRQALIARRDGNFAQACELLYRACTEGDPEAMYFMAEAYEMGGWKHIYMDQKWALSWYVKAAQHGHAAAIGLCNDFGFPGWEQVYLQYNPTYDSFARAVELVTGNSVDENTVNELFESLCNLVSKDFNFHCCIIPDSTPKRSAYASFIRRPETREYMKVLENWNEQSVFKFVPLLYSPFTSTFKLLDKCAVLNVSKCKKRLFKQFMEEQKYSTHPNIHARKMCKMGYEEGQMDENFVNYYLEEYNYLHPDIVYFFGERVCKNWGYSVNYYLSTRKTVRNAVLTWLLVGRRFLVKDIVVHIGKMVWKYRKYPSRWVKEIKIL